MEAVENVIDEERVIWKSTYGNFSGKVDRNGSLEDGSMKPVEGLEREMEIEIRTAEIWRRKFRMVRRKNR